MESQSLKSALATWQSLSAPGKRPATQLYHSELVKIFNNDFPNLDTPASSVTPEQVAEFVNRIAHYTASRFNAVLSVLRVLVPHAPKLPKKRVTPKVVNLPTQFQFQSLLTELDRDNRWHGGLIVRFLALSGLRIGEARALTWADVQPDCLLVPARNAKNGKARSIPLVPGLPEIIARLRAVANGSGFVLPQKSVRTVLTAACRRAGIARLSHHDMRRLFATRCIESGVDLPTAARWLGHSDGGALLAKTYFHLLDGHSREMAGRVKVW